MERGHGHDRGQVEQDPEGPRPDRGGREAAGELALQQPDQVGDDGQRRDDPGRPVIPQDQRHEGRDPGAVHQVPRRGRHDAGRARSGHQARGRRGEPAEQAAAPGRSHEHVQAPHRLDQHHGEHRAPDGLAPGDTGAECPRRPGTAGRPGRPRWRPPPSSGPAALVMYSSASGSPVSQLSRKAATMSCSHCSRYQPGSSRSTRRYRRSRCRSSGGLRHRSGPASPARRGR